MLSLTVTQKVQKIQESRGSVMCYEHLAEDYGNDGIISRFGNVPD